ncbi:MAG: hypothetical protein KME27_21500 [Lyngbya sp. HA4199-MV5]|nr:hypothetical protein [Lyngbya sp. HA4199-MV5]
MLGVRQEAEGRRQEAEDKALPIGVLTAIVTLTNARTAVTFSQYAAVAAIFKAFLKQSCFSAGQEFGSKES